MIEENKNSALCVGRGRVELSGMTEIFYIFTDVSYALSKFIAAISICK